LVIEIVVKVFNILHTFILFLQALIIKFVCNKSFLSYQQS
jgi:hypothetical protein